MFIIKCFKRAATFETSRTLIFYFFKMDAGNNELAKPTELSGRQRKKLYHKLREQMEFYFSDSNLAKDKFLYSLIQQNSDGYVDLEVFKTFNKIKALAEDVNLIAASLSRSEILEVSEDKSKVRRKTEIEMSKDFDACTLYVEGLPGHADHKWIKDIFEHFGTVDYINIPRYKISHKIKGFAFIEYSSAESVVKACQFYENSTKTENNTTSEDETVETKEGKVRKADDSGSKKIKRIKFDKIVEADKEPEQSENNDLEKQHTSPVKIKKKRKLEKSETDDAEPCKKRKTDSNNQEAEKSFHLSGGENNLSKGSMEISASELTEDNCNNGDAKEDSSKAKKKRKHSRKNRVRHERPSLRVMSKAQWKNYRNRYLELQRTTMSFLKQQILLESKEMRIHDSTSKQDHSQKKEFKFLPGVIIKVHLPKNVENPSDIKEQIKSSVAVAYIEANSGSDLLFVRCHSSEDANAIIQDGKLNHIGTTELLTDSSEEEYWKKIMSDREAKLNMPRKRRGRDKLIAKAAKLLEHRNKHIYYD